MKTFYDNIFYYSLDSLKMFLIALFLLFITAICITTLYCIAVHLHYQEQIANVQWWFADRKQERANGTIKQPSTFSQQIYELFLDFEYEYYMRRHSKQIH